MKTSYKLLGYEWEIMKVAGVKSGESAISIDKFVQFGRQLMTKEDFGKLGYHDESATMNSKSDLGSVG